MDASLAKNSSVESEPSTEGAPAVPRVVSEGVGDEAEEGDELEDSESEAGWRQSAAALRLYRFRPGPWISFEVPTPLFEDMTNYPLSVRSQIVACIVSALSETETFKDPVFRETPVSDVEVKMKVEKALEELWGLDAEAEATQEVSPDLIVPRFLWYQRELEKLYGVEGVKETIVDRGATTFGAVPSSAQEEAESAAPIVPTPEVSNDSLDAEGVSEEHSGSVDFTSLKSPIIVRKKKKKVGVATHIAMIPVAEGAFGDASGALVRGRMDRTDALSMTIRDMQFRLSRHGTVADPRSYMGKGDTSYDRDDPFFDDEELMMEIGLTKEDLNQPLSEQSGDEEDGIESDVSDGESGMDRLGEIYEGTEDYFLVDNYSEESDEEMELPSPTPAGDSRFRKGAPPRVIQTFPFPKPTSCPVVFNPRGWHKIRQTLTPLAVAFFYTLECVVPSKRLPSLQKGIFETAELAVVDTSVDPPRLRLNDEGKQQVSQFLRQVFLACYSSFLLIFLPPHGPKCLPAISLPRHSRVAWTRLEQLPEINSVLCHGFVDYDPDMPEVIESVIRTHITPYIPPRQDLKSWFWTAIAHHTFRIFSAKEDATMNDLDEFFRRRAADTPMGPLNERIRGWSARLKAQAKNRATKKGSESSSAPDHQSEESAQDKRQSGTEPKVEADVEDEAFVVFDEISSGVINYAISFNLRRNVFRDIFDAGEYHLLKMFYPSPGSNVSASSSQESLQTTSATDIEKQKLERALSMSWASRLVQLFEDSSAKFCDPPIKPSAAWLESRLRRFRKQVKVPNLYERRKPKAKAVKQDGRASPVKRDSAGSATLQKRRRPGEPRSSDSVEGSTPAPPSKRRKAEPPKSFVSCLRSQHDVARLLAIIQMSPFVLPLQISCRVQSSYLDEDVIDVEEKSIMMNFMLVSIESWDLQSVEFIPSDSDSPPKIDETLRQQTFTSLADALAYAERIYSGHAINNSAVRDEQLRAWQVFEINTERAAFPYDQATTGWMETRISLLDLLSLHLWIQHFDVGTGDGALLIGGVFVSTEEIARGFVPPRYLSFPASMASNLFTHKADMLPPRPEGPDRIRQGQLAFLAKHHGNQAQFLRSKMVLPPWSRTFTRAGADLVNIGPNAS